MQQSCLLAGGVSLRQLLPESRIFGGDDVWAHACCGTPHGCQPGDIFVALHGPEGDSHDCYQQAVDSGAAAIVAERLLPVRIPVCVVPSSQDAYGRICQTLAGNPADEMCVVGVTGTNGKTTTSLLLASVLEAAQQRTGLLSSLRRCDSIATESAHRTTPAPPELARWLTRMSSHGCSHAVVELSSRGLAQRRAAGVKFDAAVLTNLRRDHLDYHGSILNYRQAKMRLLEQLKPGGFAVINADDAGSQACLAKLRVPSITVGQREQADLNATVIERHASEQTFLLTAGNESVPVRTRTIGDHHIANCLSAAGVALVMGIDLATIARGLEAIEHVPGRLERVECGQEFGVYVDLADTPDRLAMALKALRKVTSGRIICAFGGSEDRPAEDRAMLGRVLERATDLSVLTSQHVMPAEPLQLIHDLLDGYDRPARAHVIPTREQALLWALSKARPGDAVLLAGEGRSPAETSGPRLAAGGDYEIAREWLHATARRKPILCGVN